ncbi:dUTP diphosphatase [Candidatus Aerophobetes bacterium]|nr:dUTP diphosphatase [Candidatus Aerophobetes bacterium]
MEELKIKLIQLDLNMPSPVYAHKTDVGCDLYSRVDALIKPGERKLIPTGIKIAIPKGYAGFIHPRSGLALKYGVSILNSPGLIDPGYRGEIAAILINHDKNRTFKVKRGDKICQLVIQKFKKPRFQIVKKLNKTERGEDGFGSSGINKKSAV